MGRFDALSNLEETTKSAAPQPVIPSPTPTQPLLPKQTQPQIQPQTPPQPQKTPNEAVKKPKIMKSRNHDNKSPINNKTVKPEKYSTLLDPCLAKKVRVYAAENEVQKYEVIALALKEFFDKHK